MSTNQSKLHISNPTSGTELQDVRGQERKGHSTVKVVDAHVTQVPRDHSNKTKKQEVTSEKRPSPQHETQIGKGMADTDFTRRSAIEELSDSFSSQIAISGDDDVSTRSGLGSKDSSQSHAFKPRNRGVSKWATEYHTETESVSSIGVSEQQQTFSLSERSIEASLFKAPSKITHSEETTRERAPLLVRCL